MIYNFLAVPIGSKHFHINYENTIKSSITLPSYEKNGLLGEVCENWTSYLKLDFFVLTNMVEEVYSAFPVFVAFF